MVFHWSQLVSVLDPGWAAPDPGVGSRFPGWAPVLDPPPNQGGLPFSWSPEKWIRGGLLKSHNLYNSVRLYNIVNAVVKLKSKTRVGSRLPGLPKNGSGVGCSGSGGGLSFAWSLTKMDPGVDPGVYF